MVNDHRARAGTPGHVVTHTHKKPVACPAFCFFVEAPAAVASPPSLVALASGAPWSSTLRRQPESPWRRPCILCLSLAAWFRQR